MKAMLTGLAAVIVVAAGANYALDQMGFSSQKVYSSQNVRLD
ncbi:hypothetical protein [Thalassovita sp.]|nr:hypothetical protein [Thalassovita sp.]